jgi:exopolyphosphatase/guanosine-5'-triphosphate,3'-diphosphate pyrophosphatase
MERTEGSHKRAAVVDCGTNTFTMVIADLVASHWVEIFHLRCQVFLGKGGFASSAILPDRFAKGLDALGILKAASQNYDVDEVRVFGTSALRDASNADDFVTKAKNKVGWEIEIIDGDEEADLIQAGVQLTLSNMNAPLMIMDIGGGSLELIILASGESCQWEKCWAKSFDAGVSRLAEFGRPSDPLLESGAQRYVAYLDEILASMGEAVQLHQPKCLVGSSGSFDTFMELVNQAKAQAQFTKAPATSLLGNSIHPPTRLINRDGLAAVHDQLLNLDLSERLALPGMAPARARLIPLSSMLVQYVLYSMPADSQVYQSSYALREGALRSMTR